MVETEAGPPHHGEPHMGSLSSRLNWLRAGVMGANDGIVSVAGLVVGVAAATTDVSVIATAGVAGLVAGAVSMALGEYVSVSTQRDSELALIRKERRELEEMPEAEFQELVGMLRAKGLSPDTSHMAARELTDHDALGVHLELEMGIDRHDLVNPWAAAISSGVAFSIGSLLPLVAILMPPVTWRLPVAFASVLVALTITGAVSAHLGGAAKRPAVFRLVVGGALAMVITFAIGELLGVTIA